MKTQQYSQSDSGIYTYVHNGRLSHSQVSFSNVAQGTAREKRALAGHEVGIALDGGVRVEVRNRLVQERNLTGGIGVGCELGNPDAADAELIGEADRRLDMLLELVEVVTVPVDRHDLSAALATALGQELTHPRQTHRAATVGHGGGHQSGTVLERCEVLLVGIHGLGRGHVGLLPVVGLVEAQEAGAAGGEGLLGSLGPTVEHLRAPEHRAVFDALRDLAVGDLVPVVGPAGG